MNKPNEPRSPKPSERNSGQAKKEDAGNSQQYRTHESQQKQNGPQSAARGERQEKKLAQGEEPGSAGKSKNS
ncbi:hypothetical protein IB234_20635 [Pseudomonas sp. PDM16]|uniref:hypothetical protein n=1 Tax=Pseudomonas sp. PDM16 TaxID=2769292 RepID=UPI001780C21E|nr:hypothetical protein [Pseudomonas sp. PDM16]MBD9416979.1 hypothetical protein [Pseudomonas sp. PDM16]